MNNIPKFIMLVGLPASGKSYIAKQLSEEYNANIHSSDAIREELSGNINNQDINGLVFDTLHKRVKEDLSNGKSCIYDATNIKSKRRRAFLSELNKYKCQKICYLIATPIEECYKRNNQRDRTIPKEVIDRMYYNFEVPWYYEGWGKIVLINDAIFKYRIYDFDILSAKFNQDNPHHTLTLGQHCSKVEKYIRDNMSVSQTGLNSEMVREAGWLHDNGKLKTKTFVNAKGETTDIAHYYHHENVGSYDSLFYEWFEATKDNGLLYRAVLILNHMKPYIWEKDNNEKLHNKYKNLWGDTLYNDIMLIHEADKFAH